MKKEIKRGIGLVFCLMLATAALMASRIPLLRSARWHPPTVAHTSGPVEGGSTTMLPSGRILLLGGNGPSGPVDTAAILDPNNGAITTLATVLLHARAWHSATLLPDGSVVIFGGIGSDGSVVNVGEVFDPQTGQFKILPASGSIARAYHSATLLTDGRVLVAGGANGHGESERTLELWDYRSQGWSTPAGGLIGPRSRHTATLLADGTVLLWGGVDANGSSLNYGEIFDPGTQGLRIQTLLIQPANDSQPPQLEESKPADNSTDVSVDTLISLRFSKPLQVLSVNQASAVLSGPEGNVATKVVPAEGGMLAFISPQAPLENGTAYTLSLRGLVDNSGQPLADTQILFTTSGTPSDSGTGVLGTGGPAGSASDPLNSGWRKLTPLKAAPGVTALSGQVLTLDGEPLSKVTLEIEGGDSTRTDSTGRFLLERLTSGHHVMWIDGQTANSQGKTYGLFEVGVDISAGQTNVLNYTIWMPLLDMANAVAVNFPTEDEVVIKSPLLPGLELHLPPQTTIFDRKGKVVDKISITPIPLNQPPFPLPTRVSVPLYFTIQPGGAYIKVGSTDGPQGARLFYPNAGNHPAGTVFNFWNYDADEKGWFVYGQGAVSPDRTQVIPSPGVFIYEFTGAMVSTGYAPAVGPKPGNPDDGDPVDLGTGLFVYTKTDLVEPDVIPIVLTRTYRQNDGVSRAFGIGTTHPYDIFLDGTNLSSPGGYTWMDLILPDGGRVHFVRTSPCTGTNGNCDFSNAVYSCTTPNSFYGATMQWTGVNWYLMTKDGTSMSFPESDFPNAINAQGAAITSMTDRNGNSLTFTRDANKNLTQITTMNGRWIQFTIDASNRITQATDQSGRIVRYTYDASGRLSTVTDANNGVTTYTYDSNNSMLTIKDPRQIVYLTNQYDANNRVQKQTQADNGTFQFTYTLDGNGKVTQTNVTDTRADVRQVNFNSDGYVISDTAALGKPEQQTLSYTRQPGSNLVLSTTDALNRQTAYTYDGLGNVTSVTPLAGTANAVTTLFAYESKFNKLTGITDPLGHTTTFIYDSNGNLVSAIDPLGNVTSRAYNSFGQPVSTTDAMGNTTQFSYDLGDLVSITDPLGRTTYHFLDSAGRLGSVTDPLGHITKYAYNPLNEVTSVTDASGNMTSLAYDPDGNLLSVTDTNNHQTQFTYDSMDRSATRKDALLNQESYQYDGNGNLTQFTDRRGKVAKFSYDGLNRMTFAGFGWTTGTNYESTVNYTLDAGSRLTQVVDSISGTITRGYDGLDRLTSDATPQGTVSYTFDNAGRRTSLTVAGEPVVNYGFGNADRLTQITQGTATVSLTYDNANRRATLTLPNGVVATYSYDAASELGGITYTVGSTMLGNLTYGYDSARHRTSVNGSFAGTGLPLAVSQTAYNASNQVTQWGTANLFYDLNGNMTSDGTHSYAWDARNRLTNIDSGSTASFVYDPFGRRVSKTISSTQTGFLYDRGNPVQELSGAAVTANLLTGGLDEYFTRTDSSGARHFLTDALGSTLALADSSATIQTSYKFEPFGNTAIGGAPSMNSFAYTGREADVLGIYYYRARYYSPTLQRFIGEDPLDGSSVVNGYTYASDDPIDRVDPTGLSDLVYVNGVHLLVVVDGNGNIVGAYPAYNNAVNGSAGPYPEGLYPFGGHTTHPDDGPDSPFGPSGNLKFPRPDCPLCGVHSGRTGKPDALGRTGPRHGTEGCIRTTDDAMKKVLDLVNGGDPLQNLLVINDVNEIQ